MKCIHLKIETTKFKPKRKRKNYKIFGNYIIYLFLVKINKHVKIQVSLSTRKIKLKFKTSGQVFISIAK